jgi:DNA repair protein RadC
MSGEMIADLPLEERPRERLAMHGPSTLSDAELMAILLGSGSRGKSALQVARKLVCDGLPALSRREASALSAFDGIGPAKSARIAAALELGRRIAAQEEPSIEPVRDPVALGRSLVARYAHYVQERLGAIYLDAKNRPIREREIYVGTLNTAAVSTRDILRFALEDHAAGIVVFHNHPSGDPAPSAEDLLFTRKLVEAGKLMGIDIIDHLIIGATRFVSLKQRGAM